MAGIRLRRGPRNMAAGPLDAHIRSFTRSLRALKRSRKTISMYREAVAWFAAEHLLAGGQPNDIDHRHALDADTGRPAELETFDPVWDWEDVDRSHVETWIVRLHERGHKSSYVNNQYRCLQQFFRWLAEEEEIPNPMRKTKPPKVTVEPVPVFEQDETDRILAQAKGRGFLRRRDFALMSLLRDTGMRLQELAGLTLADVDLDRRKARVTGKGERTRWVRFTPPTALALDRYLRERSRRDEAHLEQLWLSVRGGPISRSGIYQMIRRRAGEAGVPEVYPHRFRHHFSHEWLARGGAEGDLQELNGWESGQMLRRYGRSAAAARAQSHYDKVMSQVA
ncbi:tyrosine-type recombinase/integrase [Nocardiopsis sp. HNM0947]|uniref:Tyrosine-type recombinase/integrase n=1 Tax=Nocardiopsis coralli TaxID=2772213 RepID=A0ABR9P4D1_9ACTN|nr:tyrosine-type recombinase/integrase [Nocardiopsis coralli]MBE2998703.1 tyrosine-type recombinase/integrase [Nocardiopsis coralli]